LNSNQKQALVVQAAGPGAYSLAELVRLSGNWSGNTRPVFGIPAGIGKLQALMMEWLPGEPLMSRDNLDSLKTPNVAQAGVWGLQDFGITPAALQAIAPGYLKRQSQRTRLDAYRASKR
jgi:NADH dehydrogenase